MEIIRGKKPLGMETTALLEQIGAREHIIIDLGTGDGRFVSHLADQCPVAFVIGVDACRENLRTLSRARRDNALFVIANAQCLPRELYGLADRLCINFPWGSLLDGLLRAEPGLMTGLLAVSRPGALLEVRLNAAALAEAGCTLEQGAERVRDNLRAHGFSLQHPRTLDVPDLRRFPSTWARRLAFGRDPRSMVLSGSRAPSGSG